MKVFFIQIYSWFIKSLGPQWTPISNTSCGYPILSKINFPSKSLLPIFKCLSSYIISKKLKGSHASSDLLNFYFPLQNSSNFLKKIYFCQNLLKSPQENFKRSGSFFKTNIFLNSHPSRLIRKQPSFIQDLALSINIKAFRIMNLF